MRKLFLLFFFFVSAFAIFAAKLENRYIMKSHKDGQLYFILPYDIPAEEKNIKNLSADITYLTSSDSVTMNISVWNENELNTDSIVLVGEEYISITDFKTFFIEKDGKLWLHRYSFRISLEDLVALYSNQLSFALDVHSEKQTIRYLYPIKKWKSEQEWMSQILYIIKRNKLIYNQNR